MLKKNDQDEKTFEIQREKKTKELFSVEIKQHNSTFPPLPFVFHYFALNILFKHG